ncbi:MAG TPA: peptide chain release factor N(5)-glutamine methyltransferase [Nitrospirales bacterium]|nr:peptide chain release factor N(5)-glutamine methyltransferase [Nitrospirales bacterium]
MTIHEILEWARGVLEQAGVESARGNAEHLLDHCLGIDRTARFFVRHERVLSSTEEDAYRRLVARRADRTPLQYLLGKAPFLNDDFVVDERVLIPRPETEQVVEVAIRLLREEESVVVPVILDIGTGSGAIAVSLAKALQAKVWASDVSLDALEVAQTNLQQLKVEEQVTLVHGDLLRPFHALKLEGRVDLVISNPPYIPHGTVDQLAPEISQHEPRGALDGGVDGCDFYRAIVPAAILFLKPGLGWLILELGDGLAKAVGEVIRDQPELSEPRVFPDLNGKDRVIVAKREQ